MPHRGGTSYLPLSFCFPWAFSTCAPVPSPPLTPTAATTASPGEEGEEKRSVCVSRGDICRSCKTQRVPHKTKASKPIDFSRGEESNTVLVGRGGFSSDGFCSFFFVVVFDFLCCLCDPVLPATPCSPLPSSLFLRFAILLWLHSCCDCWYSSTAPYVVQRRERRGTTLKRERDRQAAEERSLCVSSPGVCWREGEGRGHCCLSVFKTAALVCALVPFFFLFTLLIALSIVWVLSYTKGEREGWMGGRGGGQQSA